MESITEKVFSYILDGWMDGWVYLVGSEIRIVDPLVSAVSLSSRHKDL